MGRLWGKTDVEVVRHLGFMVEVEGLGSHLEALERANVVWPCLRERLLQQSHVSLALGRQVYDAEIGSTLLYGAEIFGVFGASRFEEIEVPFLRSLALAHRRPGTDVPRWFFKFLPLNLQVILVS